MKQPRPIPVRNQVAAAVSAAMIPGLLAVPAPALAQDALEEIVVTATRRTRSVQEIPINITALNTGELEKNRLYGLSEISKLVPGLQIVDRGPRDEAPDIIVRGLNSDGLGPGFSSGTVATYLGDIPVAVDLKTNDLQTVEVLIGPQGTLYGSGTLGGAIRYIPNKPDATEFSAEVHTSVYGLSQAASVSSDTGFIVNVPLIQDELAFRASIDYLDDSGFIDYNYVVRESGVSNPEPNFSNPADVAQNLRRIEDADSEETISGRLGLRWTPANVPLDATLWYYFQNVNAGGRTLAHVEAFNTGPYESGLRYEEPNDYDNELFSLEVTADLGFAELTSATGYSLYEELGQRDQTDLLLDFEYGYEFFPTFSSFTREIVEEETLVQELRLVSTGEGPLSWIIGGYYNTSDLFATSEEFTPGFDQFAIDNFGGVGPRPDSLEYFELTVEEFTEQALFGEISYTLTDAWDVTLGFRLYEFETEVQNGFDLPLLRSVFIGDAPNSPPLGADAAASGFTTQPAATDDDGSLFKFNTSYRLGGDGGDTDALVYLTVSEGYRIGGVNSVPECTAQELANPGQALCAKPDEILIKPDTTTNYEIGLHSTWLNNSLLLNAALFYIDWEDIQVSAVTDNGSLPITANGSGAESQGIELTSRWVVSENWEFGGNLSYTKAELTEDAPGLIGSLTAPAGARLPGSPETQAALFADYSRILEDGKTFSVRYLMSYTGDVFNIVGGDEQLPLDPDNNNLPTDERKGESIPGYALHNLSATIEDANWKFTVFADNLFDKRAITGTRTTQRFLSENRGLINGFRLRSYGRYISRPRSIGVSFTYNF